MGEDNDTPSDGATSVTIRVNYKCAAGPIEAFNSLMTCLADFQKYLEIRLGIKMLDIAAELDVHMDIVDDNDDNTIYILVDHGTSISAEDADNDMNLATEMAHSLFSGMDDECIPAKQVRSIGIKVNTVEVTRKRPNIPPRRPVAVAS